MKLESEHERESSFVLNQRGRRMQKDTYNRILKMIIHRTANERIKNKTINIHNLRHSIASHLLRRRNAITTSEDSFRT
ncbi:MAG: tyrosine-type recombinase/integrase [Saprospiraceae bacterium]|nr:tyrosine-type recombinase/integrase [Candidatus Vicinibacter affinis]